MILILAAIPVAVAQEPTAFEVASINLVVPAAGMRPCMCERQDGLAYRFQSLRNIIQRAYDLQDLQLVGPDWLSEEFFDVSTKAPAGTTRQQWPMMLQSLLVQRFKLTVRTETKTLSGFALMTGRGGSKLTPLKSGSSFATPRDRTGRHIGGGMAVATLCLLLSKDLQRPVSDETELSGLFDIKLDYALDSLLAAPDAQSSDVVLASPLTTSLQEQLGLKLEPKKIPTKVVTVEHIEKTPLEN